MVEELQKRPFARPLLFWITGTLLQVFLPDSRFLLLLLLSPVILIGLSYFVPFENERVNLYENRWVWGVVFILLLISLAFLKTEHSRTELYEKNPFPRFLQLAEEKQKQLLSSFETLQLTEQEKSVLSTITVGYRKDMNKGMRQRFAVGGVAHILSVSGFHAVIGGEGNGGVIYPELHYGRDALVGIALFLTHLANKKMKTSDLRATYPPYFISKQKVQLTQGMDVDAILAKVKDKFAAYDITDIDGVKIDFPDKWVHLRKSNTEPIIRIYSEAHTMQEAEEIGGELIQIIKEMC